MNKQTVMLSVAAVGATGLAVWYVQKKRRPLLVAPDGLSLQEYPRAVRAGQSTTQTRLLNLIPTRNPMPGPFGVQPKPPTKPPPKKPPKPIPVPSKGDGLTVMSFNLAGFRSEAGMVKDLERLIRLRPGVIGFQEAGSAKAHRTLRRLRVHGYGLHQPVGPAGSTPSAYDKRRYRLLSKGASKISPRTNVGDAGKGPATLKEKSGVWMELQDKVTGEKFYHVNAHLAPSQQLPLRGALARQQVRGLRDIVQRFAREGDPVFLTGDFNFDYRKVRGRAAPLRDIGLRANWDVLGFQQGRTGQRGTHKNRYIDTVFALTRRLGGAKALQQRTFNVRGDHDALMVKYRLR